MGWVLAHEIPREFTFDCYFTSARSLNHLHSKHRGYVGDLKSNQKMLCDSLQRTISWAIEQATADAWTTPRICQVLQLV